MVVTDTDESKQCEVSQDSGSAPLDSPPPYSPPTFQEVLSQEHIPSNIKPTNFIAVHEKNSSIRGVYAIDPSIRIPRSLFPPSPTETEQTDTPVQSNNLQVSSRNGSVDAQIYMVPDAKPFDDRERVKLDVGSRNGSVTAKIHRAGSSQPRFALHCFAHNGAVYVGIPRSFRGSLLLSTRDGAVRLSEQVDAQKTVTNATHDAKQYYIGTLPEEDDDQDDEDEVVVQGKNGTIRVAYSDEVVESVFKGLVGMLSRLF
ncbi:hypothetical protein PM082_010811 [Marasmius tenuissimus]|nr:hypothetical protein PM082_010811 [Marasmius tenuissimus]